MSPDTTLPVLWTIAETRRQTGLGRDRVYDLIHSGEIEAIRDRPEHRNSPYLVIPESVWAWRERLRDVQGTRTGAGAERTGAPRPKGAP